MVPIGNSNDWVIGNSHSRMGWHTRLMSPCHRHLDAFHWLRLSQRTRFSRPRCLDYTMAFDDIWIGVCYSLQSTRRSREATIKCHQLQCWFDLCDNKLIAAAVYGLGSVLCAWACKQVRPEHQRMTLNDDNNNNYYAVSVYAPRWWTAMVDVNYAVGKQMLHERKLLWTYPSTKSTRKSLDGRLCDIWRWRWRRWGYGHGTTVDPGIGTCNNNILPLPSRKGRLCAFIFNESCLKFMLWPPLSAKRIMCIGRRCV